MFKLLVFQQPKNDFTQYTERDRVICSAYKNYAVRISCALDICRARGISCLVQWLESLPGFFVRSSTGPDCGLPIGTGRHSLIVRYVYTGVVY